MELFHSKVDFVILRKMIIRIISSMMIKMTSPMMITSRAEEEEVSAPLGAQLLSPFQRDKFVHFFYHVLDVNRSTSYSAHPIHSSPQGPRDLPRGL